MSQSSTLPRAAMLVAIPALGAAVLALAGPAQAFTPADKGGGESTPLNITPSVSGSHSSSSGPSLVRTIVGLLIVIAVIWGLTWILRQVKSGRQARAAGSGLESVATLPLGSGRMLHLVRAGRDYLVVGSAEHGVVPIYRYTEQQALDAGLLEASQAPAADAPGGLGASAGAFQSQARGLRSPGSGANATVIDRLREWTVRR